MSTILKALKKIEGRKVDTGLTSWPYGAGSSKSTDPQVRRSRQRQRILWLFIILSGIALAGKLYFGSRPDADDAASQSVPATGAALPEKTFRVTQPEVQETVTVTPRNVPAPVLETPPETAKPSDISSPPVKEASPETAQPSVISPATAESNETPEVEEATTTAVENIPKTTITDTFATPPADNAGLSLMALVWSQQPESRFVVINGTIVREGGNIEKSTVVRIEEDYAVIRTGGITWKLK